MLKTDKNKLSQKNILINMTFNATQQKELQKTLKCGIYKELYKRKLLSDTQLNSLLERNS